MQIQQLRTTSVYMVLGALLFFRGDELGMREMENIIFAGLSTPPAINALLDFCFSVDDLNNWVKQEWCKVYDIQCFGLKRRPAVCFR